MFDFMFKYVYRSIIVERIVDWVRKVTSKAGPDGGKTLLGYFIAAVGLVVATFPETGMWLDPIAAQLRPHALEIVVSGLGYSGFGLFDKFLKWLETKIKKERARAPKATA